jgi:hypothetical protein
MFPGVGETEPPPHTAPHPPPDAQPAAQGVDALDTGVPLPPPLTDSEDEDR